MGCGCVFSRVALKIKYVIGIFALMHGCQCVRVRVCVCVALGNLHTKRQCQHRCIYLAQVNPIRAVSDLYRQSKRRVREVPLGGRWIGLCCARQGRMQLHTDAAAY